MTRPETVVLGQIGRDLVLGVDDAPEAGGSAVVRSRREMLGGKGANQAVGLAQLNVPVGLVGVVGDDAAGERVLAQAFDDGIDVSSVVHRSRTATALIVDIVDGHGDWRYLEDIPPGVLATADDVRAAEGPLGSASSVLLQLQQPLAAVLPAARAARAAGARVVLDGAPLDGQDTAELLGTADVLRADAREAGQLAGTSLAGVDHAVDTGREIIRRGPSLVVLDVPAAGNVFVDRSRYEFVPFADVPVADTTGAGDALVGGLTYALSHGWDLPETARFAVAAAAATVRHSGGRPNLWLDELRILARDL